MSDISTKNLENLIKSLISEANDAPNLFSDLAKVEQYIAESYKTRSFIELIQNADDAGASKVGVYSISNSIIVFNNGRPFNIQDIEALCRSGASNKQRGKNTIGYRGIGFKSVINLSKKIFIKSDQYNLCFDKTLTKKILNAHSNDVPLIRIPHIIKKEEFPNNRFVNELCLKENYKTAFIFLDVNLKELNDDFISFDNTASLFLRNILEIKINLDSVSRDIKLRKEEHCDSRIVIIQENNCEDRWRTIFYKDSPANSIALKLKNDLIIPALEKESVIHSFTPTYEFSGAYFKINGDYSTDPSRKNIDFDLDSEMAFNIAVSIIGKIIVSIISGNESYSGFFSTFHNVKNLESNRFRKLLRKNLFSVLNQESCEINEKIYPLSNLRLFPQWINYEDYEIICSKKFAYIKGYIYKENPEIFDVLTDIGFQTLSLNEIIEDINNVKISITGMAQLSCKIINQMIYELSDKRLDILKNLKIFPINGIYCNSIEIQSGEKIDPLYMKYLFENVNTSDLKYFFKKLAISYELNAEIFCKNDLFKSELKSETSTDQIINKLKIQPEFTLQKWRSAEQNALEYIRTLPGIILVKDISKANLGYDIEVTTSTGKTLYVEVKSVKNIGEKFRLTNNEYSSAHHYNKNYYLAIVCINSAFQIYFIRNPIATLSLQKQCENWVWLCEDYQSLLIDEIGSD
ncbi:DUF3883 domain-containing protein [Methanospirillum sp.]